MKKEHLFFWFLLSVLVFGYTPVYSQDTIALKNGMHYVASVSSVDNDNVHYSVFSDSLHKEQTIPKLAVLYIAYSTGQKLTLGSTSVTLNKDGYIFHRLYLSFSGGVSIPTGQYGSGTFYLINPASDELPPILPDAPTMV